MVDGFATTVPLGDLVDDVTVGHVGSMVDEYRSSGVPFLRSTNILPYRLDTADVVYIGRGFHERLRKSALRPGDLVVVRTGKPGTACVIPESLGEANCSDLVIVRPGKRADARFLAYFINGMAAGHVEAYAVGAVQQHFNIGEAKRLPVPALHVDEQRAIADVLGALDEKVELNRQVNYTLEEMASALFKSWFVDFDPIVANADGRKPFGMDATTAALFPADFVDAVPRGWRPGVLGEVCQNFDSRRVPLSGAERAKRHGRYPYHGAAGVLDHVDEFLFEGVHLLVGEDGSVVDADGRAVRQYVWGQFWVNNHAHVLRGIGGVSTEWLYLYFGVELVDPIVTGAVQPKITQGNLNRLPVVLPPAPVLRAFTDRVDPWFALRRQHDDESRTLTALRDTLLPKLLSGEVRLKQAEKLVEAAL